MCKQLYCYQVFYTCFYEGIIISLEFRFLSSYLKFDQKIKNVAMSSNQNKKPNEQEIVAHFQKLREDQRMIASKAAELQVEQKSHE